MKHNNVWEKYEQELTKTSMDRLNRDDPEIALYVAIIVQAAKERDVDFLYSEGYEYYCRVFKLQAHTLRLLFEQTWKCIDGNIPIEIPEEEVDNDDDF